MFGLNSPKLPPFLLENVARWKNEAGSGEHLSTCHLGFGEGERGNGIENV